MSELGSFLKNQREAQNMSLEDLHEDTKIRQLYLEAIERGEFEILPGTVYLKGFLRTISRELSLDYNHLLELYHKDAGVDPDSLQSEKPNTILQEIEKESQIKKRTMMIMTSLLLIVVLAVSLMLIFS